MTNQYKNDIELMCLKNSLLDMVKDINILLNRFDLTPEETIEVTKRLENTMKGILNG